jgi:hypothetical protein
VLKVDFEKGREIVTLMNAEIDKARVAAVGVTDRKEISGDNSFEWMLKTMPSKPAATRSQAVHEGRQGQDAPRDREGRPERKLLEARRRARTQPDGGSHRDQVVAAAHPASSGSCGWRVLRRLAAACR